MAARHQSSGTPHRYADLSGAHARANQPVGGYNAASDRRRRATMVTKSKASNRMPQTCADGIPGTSAGVVSVWATLLDTSGSPPSLTTVAKLSNGLRPVAVAVTSTVADSPARRTPMRHSTVPLEWEHSPWLELDDTNGDELDSTCVSRVPEVPFGPRFATVIE